MANEQLLRYVKAQLDIGASENVVRDTLAGAGWSQVDVDAAFADASQKPSLEKQAESSSQASPAAQEPYRNQGLASQEPHAQNNAKPVVNAYGVQGVQSGAFSSAETNLEDIKKGPLVIKDTHSSSGDSASDEKGNYKDMMPDGVSSAQSPRMVMQGSVEKTTEPKGASSVNNSVAKRGDGKGMWFMVSIALGVVSLSLAGGFAYAYISWGVGAGELREENSGLLSQVSSLNDEVRNSQARNAEFETLVASLTEQNEKLMIDLSFFAEVPSLSGSSERGITINARIGKNVNGSYFFTTANGAVVAIVNYKVSEVGEALAPLVGQDVDISGTYVTGSRNFTVTAINGVAIDKSQEEAVNEGPELE